LSIPIYFLDLALFAGKGGGSWITLDFRGLLFWTYITLLAIQLVLSSIAVLSFPKSGLLRIHVSAIVLSIGLLVVGIFAYGKLHRLIASNEQRALMESRRQLMNAIDLKEWWYVPDENHPTEIRVKAVVHRSGRFAGNVSAEATDASGLTSTVFESINEPGSERQVQSGEVVTYAFSLKVLRVLPADDLRITLYLFEARSGPSAGDIAKVFMKSPTKDDDGEYFYGVLPPPSRIAN
jgi:hypothetical protein